MFCFSFKPDQFVSHSKMNQGKDYMMIFSSLILINSKKNDLHVPVTGSFLSRKLWRTETRNLCVQARDIVSTYDPSEVRKTTLKISNSLYGIT